MTTTYLLDANVLIALTVVEHEHHDAVAAWTQGVGRLALCPVVEGALVRFLVRVGEQAVVAAELLRGLHAHPRFEFWPDAVSYAAADLSEVRGHRQVTDSYLSALVAARTEPASLATMDRGLHALWPAFTTLIPVQ